MSDKDAYEKLGLSSAASTDDALRYLWIGFMEELSKTWEYTLEAYDYTRTGDNDSAIRSKEKMDEIVRKAHEWLYAAVKLRVKISDTFKNATDKDRRIEMLRCKNDRIHWINTWLWIQDPRMGDLGLPTKIPFIMYPAQEHLYGRIGFARKNRFKKYMISKSREAGITQIACAYCLGEWQFEKGFTASLGSEKSEKVEVLGSFDPLFGKIRYMLYSQPEWMRPRGFEAPGGSGDSERKIINKVNDCELIGEIGDNIGRSGRKSIIVIDEYQDISNPSNVNSATESSTNCVVHIGTIKGSNHFYQMRESKKAVVDSIWWYQDPRKNPRWRENKPNSECWWRRYAEATTDSWILAQEYDQDPAASVTDSFIPAEWVRAAVEFDIEDDDGPNVAGFDVAGSGDAESVYIRRKGCRLMEPKIIVANDPTQATMGAVGYAEEDRIDTLYYDAVAIGANVKGIIGMLDDDVRFELVGIMSGAAASSELIEEEGRLANKKFGNKRAELWWRARQRFRKTYEMKNRVGPLYGSDELISIPNNQTLITQLSQPKIVHRGAKIYVESKKEMKTRGIISVDHADSAIFTEEGFSTYSTEHKVVPTATRDRHKYYKEFKWDAKTSGDTYVSLVQRLDMNVNAVIAVWDALSRVPKLKIVDELTMINADPVDVVAQILDRMPDPTKKIKEWVGNSELFIDYEKGMSVLWNAYRKAKVILRQNYFDDDRGNVVVLNQLIERGQVEIRKPNCEHLMLQLQSWVKTHGSPDQNFPLAQSLSQLVTKLRAKKVLGSDFAAGLSVHYGGSQGRFARTSIPNTQEEADVRNYIKTQNEHAQSRAEVY